MDIYALIQTLGVALLGAIPGLLAFLIQRRQAMLEAKTKSAELDRLKDTSIVSLVEPLQKQVAFLVVQLETCQGQLAASELARKSHAKHLARLIDRHIDSLETFRDKILEIDKENGDSQ